MVAFHLIVGIAVLISTLAAGVWGGLAWYQRRPSVGFWYVLRASQALVVIQVSAGALLLLLGREAADGLHYVYGTIPILVSLLAEGARSAATDHELEGIDFEGLPRQRQQAVAAAIVRRETGIMAVSALVVFGLALRAALLSPAL